MTRSALLPILLIFFAQSTFSNAQDKPDQLIEWFRHGTRGPLNEDDPSWPKNEIGILLPIGMRQMYVLGRVLGDKYAYLFGESYNYTNNYVLADTDVRCIQSTMALLQGIYNRKGVDLDVPSDLAVPPYQDPEVQEIAAELNTTAAIPHHIAPFFINIVANKNQTYLFQTPYYNVCPNVAVWEKINMNSTANARNMALFNSTFAWVNEHVNTKMQIHTFLDVYNFVDTILSDIADNKPLFDGLQNQPEVVLNLTNSYQIFEWVRTYSTPIQRYTFAYNSVQEILNQLAYFKSGHKYNVTALYACHDINIMAILTAFNVINEECLLQNFYDQLNNRTLTYPACFYSWFATDLTVEFYNKTDTPYVRLYYCNIELFLCHDDEPCSYDEFVFFANNATGNNTFASWEQDCGLIPSNTSTAESLVMNSEVSTNEQELMKQVLYLKYALAAFAIICTLLCYKAFGPQRKNKEAKGTEEAFTGYTEIKREQVIYA